MIIGVLKEALPETRVSLLPEHIASIKKWNVDILIEEGCGNNAFAPDSLYQEAGAIVSLRADVLSKSDIILCLNLPSIQEASLPNSKVWLGLYQPLNNWELVAHMTALSATIFSIDMIPRTTRAQPMDVLSSQANIAGYKAVLLAANTFPRYFPMLMTAAGSIAPAKMLILGAGVAGLQAVATARRLGAIVEVFDTRPAVKEEVLSLGAKFVEVEGAADASTAGGYAVEQTAEFHEKQKARIAQSAAKSDIIISTAQIPGKKAPILITSNMIDEMKQGSVIIDLAASTGGNTDLTQDQKTIVHKGITIIGNSLLPATMPFDASRLYGKNILNFLRLIIDKDGKLNLNFEDDLVKGTCIIHDHKITNDRLKALMPAEPLIMAK